MDCENTSPANTYTHVHTAGGRRQHTAAATLEEQLLRYSENTENEGEEEYLEEEVLQVLTLTTCLLSWKWVTCFCDVTS